MSGWHLDPNEWDFEDLDRQITREVIEEAEKASPLILGPDGEPFPYQSKKLGYLGFYPLKEQS